MSKLDKVLYTAWRSRSSGGYLDVKSSKLGASINGHNPKQLPPLFQTSVEGRAQKERLLVENI